MKWILLGGWLGAILFAHFRGAVRLPLGRQLLDHSILLAPVNAFMVLTSKVATTPYIPVQTMPDLKLLEAFRKHSYQNHIGPGVYDIHSPRVPSTQEMLDRLNLLVKFVPAERLWINPDCGLKTRREPEVKAALTNMVQVARSMRAAVEE